MVLNPSDNFPGWKAFDCISIGICVIDHDFNVVFWNEYMELWTNLKKDKIINEKINKYFLRFDTPFINEQIKLVMEGWPPFVFSSQLHEPIFYNTESPESELVQDVKVSGFEIDNDNKYVIISVENVTDINHQMEVRNLLYDEAQREIYLREEAMERVVESESRLKELDQMKNQLFSIIGHDLLAPMATLYQFSDMMLKNPARLTSDNVQIMNDMSKSALDLLQNLLDWAKIQMKGTTFSPSSVNVFNIVQDIILHFGHAAEMKKVTLHNLIQKDTEVFADINMLHTLIRNLTGNALKYSIEDGEISIEVSSNSTETTISVIDTGIGMDEDTINNIFIQDKVKSRFGTNNEKGTGLGLMLCKNIMDMHKGKILVESKVDKGSVFKLSFPSK